MSNQFLSLIDSGKLQVDYRVDGGVLSVRFAGSVDEDANLGRILELLTDLGAVIQLIQFDLGLVTMLNSCGVREWLMLMEHLSRKQACAFVNVNELFVEQANMISNVFGPKRNPVLSFQAPYHCNQCNREESRLLDPTQIAMLANQPVAPMVQCSHCGAAMQFDSLEEEYFEFVRRMRVTHVDE